MSSRKFRDLRDIPVMDIETEKLINLILGSDAPEEVSPAVKEMGKKISNNEVEISREKLFENGSVVAPAHRSDVVGIDSVLDRIDDVIHWLRNPEEYRKYNARLEPGILFEGKPGTGKTLVSRYIATESNALFVDVRSFERSGEGIMTDRDVSDLFRYAKRSYETTKRPVVLFWDEFEGCASDRGQSSDVVKALVSQLTSELDGVGGKMDGILLIGCTNYAGYIDKALLRPGRMGLHINFRSPNRQGKSELLKYYLSKTNTSKDVDIETLSFFFEDWATAATIEESVQDAWRFAIKRFITTKSTPKPVITDQDLLEVLLNRLIGPPATFSDLTDEITRNVAIHEIGHAMAAILFNVPLRLITIRAGDKSLGRVMTHRPSNLSGTIDELLGDLRVGAGGQVAEEVAEIAYSTGKESDTRNMTDTARRLIEVEGYESMFNIYGLEDRERNVTPSVGPKTIQRIDDSIKKLVDDATQECSFAIQDVGKEVINKLADILVERKTMTGKQFEDAFKSLYQFSHSGAAR